MDLPFDGPISAYYKTDAPEEIRQAIARAENDDLLSPPYPCPSYTSAAADDRTSVHPGGPRAHKQNR